MSLTSGNIRINVLHFLQRPQAGLWVWVQMSKITTTTAVAVTTVATEVRLVTQPLRRVGDMTTDRHLGMARTGTVTVMTLASRRGQGPDQMQGRHLTQTAVAMAIQTQIARGDPHLRVVVVVEHETKTHTFPLTEMRMELPGEMTTTATAVTEIATLLHETETTLRATDTIMITDELVVVARLTADGTTGRGTENETDVPAHQQKVIASAAKGCRIVSER